MTCATGTRQWVHLAFNMQKKSNIQEVEAESGYKSGGLNIVQACWVCVRKARTQLQLMLARGSQEEQDVFKGCVHVALGDMV